LGHKCAEVITQERSRGRVDREVRVSAQALTARNRCTNRMHFELQPKPSSFCLGEPVIRGSQGLEVEASERLATSCRAGAKIHDWLKDRNKAVRKKRGLDPGRAG